MKKRTIVEWRELVKEYEKSGTGQSDWCKSKGINIYTFRDRLSKLRKNGELKKETEKQIKEKASSGSESISPEWVMISELPERTKTEEKEIIVRIDKCEVKVLPGFDEATLTQVCRALCKI